MNKYTFPLTKKLSMAPIALVTDTPLGYVGDTGRDGQFIFRDGKSCDVHIAYCFSVDNDTDRISQDLQIADHGNCIVAGDGKTFQIAYKQTSPKA